MEAPLGYLAANAAAWDARRVDQMALARHQWSATASWGIFSVPESVVGLLPASVAGTAVVELGCGTAYVSAWLARQGAHPVGVDPGGRPAGDRPGDAARARAEVPAAAGGRRAGPSEERLGRPGHH